MIKKDLMQLLSHAKKHIVFQVIWQWLGLLSQIVLIYCAANLLQQGLFATLSGRLAAAYGVIIVCCIGLRVYCDRQVSLASFRASADVKRILRDKIYEKLLRLGASYREQVATAEVVQTATEGVEQLETYFGRYIPQLVYSMLAPVTLFVVLSFVSIKASLTLLICVPLIPVSIVAVQKLAKRLLSKYWDRYAKLGDSFLENLQGLTTLKIYRADEEKAKQMEAESLEFRNVTMKVLTMQLNSTSVMDIIAYGGAAIGMIVALRQFALGVTSFSGTILIVLLASEFFIPLRLLGSFFHIAMNGMAASDRIFALLALPEGEDTDGVGEVEDGASVTGAVGEVGDSSVGAAGEVGNGSVAAGGCAGMASAAICLSDVSFAYAHRGDEKAPDTLSHVSMQVSKGSFVSLVGTSGCGKSTVAGLLMGRNKGFSGSILLDGRALTQIPEAELMEHITLVSHKAYLFKGTVEENLRMGDPDATQEMLVAALSAVNLWEFLKEKDGLATMLHARGENLSGGQRQRLALARALLHDTPVYIFDEATSNIDAESEEMIMQVIRQLAKTKTVLLISHRLANVVASDRIYMMEQGKIIECGSHGALMAQGGAYRSLYESQRELEQFSKEVAHEYK